MRTIDALPIANQAPLIDEAKRRRLFSQAVMTLGALVNLTVLGVLVAIALGGVPKAVLPIATLGIAVGCAITAWGNVMRRRIG